MVTLPASVLRRYRRFSLYNSPYPAHDRGRAVDLYPATDDGPSPVAGEVLDVRSVRAPSKPYADERDHLVLVDAGEYVARVLHVEPAVEPGDAVAVGDSLGPTVRSGFFAPWVDNHVHLEFRARDLDPYRASGSERIDVDVAVDPLPWDGAGTVVEAGGTYAVLDAPAHPAPGERFVAVSTDDGRALDGGLRHYAGGGVLGERADGASERVSLLGRRVGDVAGPSHAADPATPDRTVEWADVEVLANGRPIAGLSLFAARDDDFGAKLICPDLDLAVGDRVDVAIRPTDASAGPGGG